MTSFITLPGSGGSGPAHWQTLWEEADPTIWRFQPSSWDLPVLDDWLAALEVAVTEAKEPPVLIAHSLSCLLVAGWQDRSRLAVKAAVLVAVPDPVSPVFPHYGIPFAYSSVGKLRFPSLVISSTDDPYGTQDYAAAMAKDWGSDFVAIGARGHINSDSGLGDWPQGRGLINDFVDGIG